jgi:hypothetical protein
MIPRMQAHVHHLYVRKFLAAIAFCQLLIISPGPIISAQENGAMLQPRRLIDAHTAGILPKAYYDFEFRIYPAGDQHLVGSGLLAAISVGITDRLNIGLSYGGDGLVGRGRGVRPNPYPGGLIKYRIFDENYFLPAFAIGYEHQGYGGIEPNVKYDGFVYKSQGFFIAMSKNYLFFNTVQFGLHGAVNFSLEDVQKVHWPNGYAGLDLGLNNELAISVEYDLALNQLDKPDSSNTFLNPLKGIFNLGARWAFTDQFYIEFDAKDVLENKVVHMENGGLKRLGWSRELKLVYVNHF